MTYTTNTTEEVKRYKAPLANTSLAEDGYYAAGTLHVEKTTDEDGHFTAVYTDLQGRKVLERRNGNYDTYFVYNDKNQLRFVLTPYYQFSGQRELSAYEYRYDGRGRLEKKLLPHCETEQYYYDDDDHLIYQQDAKGQLFFYLYDSMGRLAMKGTCSNFNYHHYNDVSLQDGQDGLYGTGYVFPDAWAITHGFPEEVIYYDDYSFLSKSKFTSSPHCAALTKSSPVSAMGLQTGSIRRTSSGQYLLTAIYYDNKGRVVDKRETLLNGGVKKTLTTYSFTDKPLTETVQLTRNNTTTTVTKSGTYYSANDQPATQAISYNNGSSVTIAQYGYNDLGQLTTLQRGGNGGSVTYTYNQRGWTSTINGTGFKEWLHYTDGVGTACYNGNVSSQLWRGGSESFTRGYKFSYDNLSRMTLADYGEGDSLTIHPGRYTEAIPEYTHNSSIRKIERYGKKSNGVYGKIDNLRMYYHGMQVDSVKEDALPLTYTGAFDFVSKTIPTTGVQYAYYDDGSLKWDANKGICLIEYDRHGYPQRVQFYNGNVTEYAYAADGEKLRTIYRTAVPNITVPLGTTISLNSSNTLSVDSINYVGDFIYENGQLKNYLFDGGYATISNGLPTYHYYAKDHLGNNRAVINHSTGEIEQVTHYYPFGAVYGDAGTNDALQRYKYNGKELDRMHGLNFYDYGARQYDPLLGMFTQMDPLAEKYYGISPYAYCANNPVMLVDPDGNSPLSALIKVTAKQGVKAGIKTYVKNNIEYRLKNYMSDKMLKQFAKDVDDVMGTLDNSWWETALELVPVAGDIYGGSKFAKQMTTAYNKLQDLENKYVGKIAKSLPDKERKKFIKNMRSKGVADARKDQTKGLPHGGDVKYEKGKGIDGHHSDKVSENPDKMTDPRNIKFMKQEDHIKYHQQYGY